ncbi:KH domain-containing protein At3g08620-like [Solanum dulcamara]|uniref:KH domain-containing protein At3g08620-like n=1 Tax=Solanum dulcamara TaxID=45834 RepID=UPI002486C519|nr:KH domain-containing protein At3g08620-like [Solanum dulcamara]
MVHFRGHLLLQIVKATHIYFKMKAVVVPASTTFNMHQVLTRYLAELLGERQKLGPFMQILPICSRLLNQEIMRATTLLSNQFVDQERMGQESPHRWSVSQHMNGGQINMGAWSAMQIEV